MQVEMSIEEQAAVSEMISNSMSLSVAFMTLYLTVVSGYLVVAYLAGAKLSRFQSGFITLLFVVFACHFIVSSYGAFEAAYMLHQTHFPGDVLGPSAVMNRTLAVFQLLGILGCLKFMRDVRRAG